MPETTTAVRRAGIRLRPNARREQPQSSSRALQGSHTGAHVFLMVLSALVVFPFVWQVLTSVKTFSESLRVPPTFLPQTFQPANYADAFERIPLLSMFAVSTGYALCLIVGHVFLGAMAAYAFACLRFPGRDLIFYALLTLLMVPRQLFLLPQYEIVQSLGLTNTFLGLVLPHFSGIFTVFLMRQFFLSLPRELMEAARLDGAGPFRTFFSVMLPLAKPGLLAATIITVLYSWNDLLWPLVVISDETKAPLSVGLANFQGEFLTDRPVLMAAATLAALPMIALFLVLQRQFIQGIAFTGTK
jgi:multiple sugar transport system permease protein